MNASLIGAFTSRTVVVVAASFLASPGDSVYVGSCNGFFRRLDVTTGKVQWETNVRDGGAKQYFFHGDVFIAPDRIVASADVDTRTGAEAGVHAFDRNTGRQLWKYSAGRGVLGAVVASGSRCSRMQPPVT